MKKEKYISKVLAGIFALALFSQSVFCAGQNLHGNFTINRNGQTGIAGQVYLDPLIGEKTEYEAILDIYAKVNGRIVRVERIATESDGTFLVDLPPGLYGIQAEASDTLGVSSPGPVVVTVKPNRITLVEVDVDSLLF